MDNDKDKRRFLDLILDDTTSRGYGTWSKAHDSVQRYPDQINALMRNARYQNTFITNFEHCAGRIVKFLENSDNNLPRTPDGYRYRKSLGYNIGERLVAPLLDEQYNHLTKLEVFFELLLNILLLADQSENRLRKITTGLATSPELLGKVVSSHRSEGFLREWIDSIGQGHPHAPTLAGWTETIANLCDACGGHDNQELIDKWASLRALKEELCQARTFLKYNLANQLTFRDDIRELLQQLGLGTPTSESVASAYIEEVEIRVTFNLLSGLVRSMPCRLCFSRLSGEAGSHASVNGRLRRTSTVNFDDLDDYGNDGQYEELLGKRLGYWKIALSGQALKDLQKSKSEGKYALFFPRSARSVSGGD